MNTKEAGRRLIDGRFELLGRLGSGGMGTVWRARDIVLHREVALKEVRSPDPALSEADPARARMLSERVLREARALARLAHPHVVTIHHIVDSSDGPHPWIVMELVPGQSLHDRLTQGPLSVPEALAVGRGVLSALRAAHGAGIQHRDVKPANVLLRPDGSPVLTDFGIAVLRESTSLTATGDLIGSPEYIAPERIRGEEGNPASDLWSLGMLLYTALEGHHPLRRETSLSTLVAVLDEPIPPPVRSGPLTVLLTALLTRDVAARPDASRLEQMFIDAGRGVGDGRSTTAVLRARPAAPGAATGPGVAATHPTPAGPAGTPPSTAPPYGFGPPPPPVTVFDTPSRSAPPQPRRRRWTAPVLTAAVLAAALVALLNALPLNTGLFSGFSRDQKEKSTSTAGLTGGTDTPKTTERKGDGQPGQASLPPSKQTKNLLTPDRVREAIAALKAKTGTTKFFEFTVYKEYAIAGVPVRGSRTKYDRFVYRNGYAAEEGPGGTAIGADAGPIDISKVDWDKLPALIRKADQDLGITEPTMRYVIVRGPIFESVPTVNVYLSDEYHSSGYLAADFDGSVLNTVAAD
ncbi:serine/threonine-protein kinase [Streptomyces agglomeratus]|uniref:serine/threonine-protein kinase n=1 Tax=Streptomyces agglomeratus TaxID=285458 RepID=UPI000A5D87DE|nr:serine/threonine-protein kinase [Streptomyces agglomeratus]